MKKLLLLIFYVLLSELSFSQMITDGTTYTTQQLIQDVLIGNPNFPVTNINSSTGTDFNNVNGIGYFTNNSTFPMSSGLVLSTGDILNIPGQNTSVLNDGSDGGFGWIGDAELENLTGISNTYNASSIQFDFIADISSISLDFIMVSEEYGNFECTFADIFAFIVTDNTLGISENIAVVPNTTTPISVVNVRGGANTCGPLNEQYFDQYNFTIADPNINSIPATSSPINFNGQTQEFVLIKDLIIGNSYTIKIVIADNLDQIYDSALFVQNSSFGAFPRFAQQPSDIFIDDMDNNGVEIFNLKINESQMLGSVDTSIYTFDFSYHNSLADAESGSNPIANPTSYTNNSDLETIYVRMLNPYTGKAATTSFRITIDNSLLSNEENSLNKQLIYPNPVKDKLNFEFRNQTITQINIYDSNGKMILSKICSTR